MRIYLLIKWFLIKLLAPQQHCRRVWGKRDPKAHLGPTPSRQSGFPNPIKPLPRLLLPPAGYLCARSAEAGSISRDILRKKSPVPHARVTSGSGTSSNFRDPCQNPDLGSHLMGRDVQTDPKGTLLQRSLSRSPQHPSARHPISPNTHSSVSHEAEHLLRQKTPFKITFHRAEQKHGLNTVRR